MPAKSKSQMRYMFAIASGKVKKQGLSQRKALEFVKGVKYSALPNKVRKKP